MRKTLQHPKNGFPKADQGQVTDVETALEKATAICERRQTRLTPLRRRVLEIVWSGNKPIGAYDILSVLAAERGSAAPPTVYRALEFLLENGLIHRVESVNAFIRCVKPGRDHAWQFLICRSCGGVTEISDAELERSIADAASQAGFTVQRRTVELAGLCSTCRDGQAGQGKKGDAAI